MITNILINALGQALFESCGQALIIYIALQVFMQLFPGIGSKYKYDINYLGLTIICCWFLANLVKIYVHNMSVPHYSALLYSGGITYGAKHLPTLMQQAEAFITTYAKYITGLYMIGLMLHAFRLFGGFMHIHHIRKQKNLSENSIWSAKAHELGQKLKIVKKVSLYFSEHIQIPLTIGHLKPIIIFPLALINNLDNDQVEAILLHELAHIKRYDYLLNILQCIMETILCFNPFVWLISKTIREQREYCCDDMVVDEDCNNYTYSKALFIIAQQNNQSYSLAMASTGTKKYPLLTRIKRLNTMNANDSLPKFNLLIIVAIATIGVLLAWGVPQYSVAKTRHNKTLKAISHTLNSIAPAPVVNEKSIAMPLAHKKRLYAVYRDTATNKQMNDTVKHSKSTVKIVIEDENGNKKEYNSVEELPASAKEEFLKENPSFGSFRFMDSLKFADNFKMSPEFKKQMEAMRIQGEEMRKKFNSPEFKKQMEDMQLKMKMQFNSPEWKKQMEDMQRKIKDQVNNPEFKKQMEDMQLKMKEQFSSPEWKKQMEDMQAKINEHFNNPEWKKQMEDMQGKMQEQFNSPEWKKQMKDIQKQAEKMSLKVNSPAWQREMREMKLQSEKMSKQFNSPEWKKQMEDLQKSIEDGINKNKDMDMKKEDADTSKTIN